MRIFKVLACLALLSLSACQPARPKGATGAEFVSEFHTLCPRTLRSTADAEQAFATAGAKSSRPVINMLSLKHEAPQGWPGFSTLERGDVQWRYDGPRWMGLASTSQITLDGVKQVRCKVQLSTEDASPFDWLLQYASGSMPVAAGYTDGVRVMLFKDQRASPGVTAYYVLWRGLPPAVWGAKPAVSVQYVVITPSTPADPFVFQSPEAVALARSARYCADAAPAAVAAQVAAARVGAPDPSVKPKVHDREMRAWIMRESDEWRLRTSYGEVAGQRLNDCTLRMAGLREAVLVETLAADPRLNLVQDEAYKTGRVRQYEMADIDRTLIYFSEGGPESPMDTHTLSIVEGFKAARQAAEASSLPIRRIER